MKEYVKPELEFIALVADEAVTGGDLDLEGEMGLSELPDGW